MSIKLTKEETEEAIPSIKKYILEEFGDEIGELKAQLLLDFIMTELAPYAYNQGVRDSERYFRERLEDLAGACHEDPLTYWVNRRK